MFIYSDSKIPCADFALDWVHMCNNCSKVRKYKFAINALQVYCYNCLCFWYRFFSADKIGDKLGNSTGTGILKSGVMTLQIQRFILKG
jgi:hypothetical protein